MSTSFPAPPTLAEAQAKPSATHETIDATAHSPAIKAALHLILDGMPYREAAREVGLASHQDVHRAAKREGLTEVHTSRLVAGCRRLADLTTQELERRLVEDPESIATKDLSVVGGIALDKVAKFESWGQSRGGDIGTAVIDRIAQMEGKLTLTVERTPNAGPPTIDVTLGKTSA